MEEVKRIIEAINKGDISPLYLLSGDEPYFIDLISNYIGDQILSEDEKCFDRTVLYGRETSVDDIISRARHYPMIAKKQIIILKEAQQLLKIDQLESYTKQPLPSTILVICYKYNSPSKLKKIYKNIQKWGVVFQGKKLYENQVSTWINSEIIDRGYIIKHAEIQLLIDGVGKDLNRLIKEIDKISIILPKGTLITSDLIERYIGISREFNNFELRKAIGEKDYEKSIRIINYFSKNTKSNPLSMTISSLYSFFVQILKFHGISDKSKANVSKVLEINPYFVLEYKKAATSYPMKQTSHIINTLKEIDLMSKGITANKTPHEDLFKEMLIKIFF